MTGNVAGILLNYVILGAIGFPATYFLLRRHNRVSATLALAPTVGHAMTTLACYVLVRCDLPVETWAWWWAGVMGLPGLLWAGALGWTRRTSVFSGQGAYLAALGSSFILLVVPLVIGGDNFAYFRGNGQDYTGYVSGANLVQELPYSDALQESLHSEPALRNPYFDTTRMFLMGRWVSMATLAWTATIAEQQNYVFFYGLCLLGILLAVGPAAALCQAAGLSAPLTAVGVVALAVGFWSQWVVDICALSQVMSMSLLIALVYLLARQVADLESAPGSELALLLLLSIGIVLQYCEILPLVLASMCAWLVRQLWRTSMTTKLRGTWCFAAVVGGLGLACAVAPELPEYLWGQIAFGRNSQNSLGWAEFFFSFFQRHPLPGIAGLAPLHSLVWSEPGIWGKILGGGLTVFSAACCVVLAVSIGNWLWRFWPNSTHETVNAFVLTSILSAGIIRFVLKSSWTAGKMISFGAPLTLINLLLIALLAKNHGSFHRWTGKCFQLVGVGVLIGQIGFGMTRIVLAPEGAIYQRDAHNNQLYRKHDWNTSVFFEPQPAFQANETVGLAVSDPLLQEFLWNNFRHKTHLLNASQFECSLDLMKEAPARHFAALPDYVVMENPRAETMLRDHAEAASLVVRNGSFSLVKIVAQSDAAPTVLWQSPPKLQEDGSCLVFVCALAWQDGFLPIELEKARDVLKGIGKLVMSWAQKGKTPILEIDDKAPWRFSLPIQRGVHLLPLRFARSTVATAELVHK